jgi:hypothetical protein
MDHLLSKEIGRSHHDLLLQVNSNVGERNPGKFPSRSIFITVFVSQLKLTTVN